MLTPDDDVEKYRAYETYLAQSTGILPANFIEFNEPNVQDVILRFKTFAETNADLRKANQSDSEQIEQRQLKLKSLELNHTENMMLLNAQLSDIQKKLERNKAANTKLEQKTEDILQGSKEKMKVFGEARLAIENLYVRTLVTASYWSHVAHGTKSTESGSGGSGIQDLLAQMNSNKSQGVQSAANRELEMRKQLLDKVHFVQGRMMDYFQVFEAAQQLLAKERQKQRETERLKKKQQQQQATAAAANQNTAAVAVSSSTPNDAT